VAADWPVTAVKHVVRKVGVGLVINPSTYVTDAGVPFLLGRNVRDGFFDFTNLNRMSEADSRRLVASRLHAGDVVVVRAGYPGRAAVVTPELEGANCASILILREPRSVLPEFLAAFFNSPQGRAQVKLAQYGAAQEQINVGDVVNFQIPVPPIQEQVRAIQRLDAASSVHRALADELQALSAATRERRRSVISAAVSGVLEVKTLRGRSA
jgi:type I restriction enzyme S subunit